MKRKILHILWCGRNAFYYAYDHQDEINRKAFMWLFAGVAAVSLIGILCGAWWQIVGLIGGGLMAYACYKLW